MANSKSKRKIFFYDVTLRDGSQAEGISFSLADKIHIAKILDEWGVDYIEGGWPGSNPKDISFFQEMQKVKLKNAQLTAFGSTGHAKNKIEQDPNVEALVQAKTPVCTVVGKTWDLHVREALKISNERNLSLIQDTLKYLKKKGIEVFFDAEHFFDGYKANPDYSMKVLECALDAGAANIGLCDTNGGALPHEIQYITREVRERFGNVSLGAHCHNDSGLAIANSIMIIEEGGDMVQGTINGLGERCGNADLVALAPNLLLKMGYDANLKKNIKKLTEVSLKVSEIANVAHNDKAPFVGKSAFAHKGGIHVSAVARNPKTYEHMEPEVVGNKRRVLISELSGKSNLLMKSRELNIDLESDSEFSKEIVRQIKEKENQGYHYEGAEASLELLMKKVTGTYQPFFLLKGYRAIIERDPERGTVCEATIRVEVNQEIEHTASNGNGPVQALDNALRKALMKFYPQIKDISLSDFKVRVIDESSGTGASVRVLIDHHKGSTHWSTIGVHENIITASWLALVDGVEYFLFKHQQKAKGF
jgi:2-isopropylmalate synthase